MFGGLWNIPGGGVVVVEGLWGSEFVRDVGGGMVGSYCGRLVPAACGSSYLLFVCRWRGHRSCVLDISAQQQQQEDDERRLCTDTQRAGCYLPLAAVCSATSSTTRSPSRLDMGRPRSSGSSSPLCAHQTDQWDRTTCWRNWIIQSHSCPD